MILRISLSILFVQYQSRSSFDFNIDSVIKEYLKIYYYVIMLLCENNENVIINLENINNIFF